jgi:predicted transcriptional regulator
MTTLTITIPDEVAAKMAALARISNRPIEELAGEYLAGDIEDIDEDLADLTAAMEAEAEGGEPIPWETVKAELDVRNPGE